MTCSLWQLVRGPRSVVDIGTNIDLRTCVTFDPQFSPPLFFSCLPLLSFSTVDRVCMCVRVEVRTLFYKKRCQEEKKRSLWCSPKTESCCQIAALRATSHVGVELRGSKAGEFALHLLRMYIKCRIFSLQSLHVRESSFLMQHLYHPTSFFFSLSLTRRDCCSLDWKGHIHIHNI